MFQEDFKQMVAERLTDPESLEYHETLDKLYELLEETRTLDLLEGLINQVNFMAQENAYKIGFKDGINLNVL